MRGLPQGGPQSWKRQEGSSSRGFRGSMVLPTPRVWTFGLQNRETINNSCFKPCLRHFVQTCSVKMHISQEQQ